VAIAGGASDAGRQKITVTRLDSAIDNAITAHMKSLRSSEKKVVNWDTTVAALSEIPLSGEYVEQSVTSDLWWYKDGINHYMSIKTVKPNIDQTAVAKEDLLRLTLSDETCRAYFGLYYNPYGEERSTYAHNPPMGIFDFHNDDVVLIGRDYWDTLGGEGCYDTVLDIARQVGAETRVVLENLRNE
jgi:hypothetical protein